MRLSENDVLRAPRCTMELTASCSLSPCVCMCVRVYICGCLRGSQFSLSLYQSSFYFTYIGVRINCFVNCELLTSQITCITVCPANLKSLLLPLWLSLSHTHTHTRFFFSFHPSFVIHLAFPHVPPPTSSLL